MNRKECISSLAQLGKIIKSIAEQQPWTGHELGVTLTEYNELVKVVNQQPVLNPWFTKENVLKSMYEWSNSLTEEKLSEFCAEYLFSQQPKNILLVMAGNIPLVGFHDVICVLLSGNRALCKLSSDDKTLLPAMTKLLTILNPDFEGSISFLTGPVTQIDAVIATGSDNSSLHFEQYFGKYPHLFRKNRTSVAVITGDENEAELEALGKDMFEYFGKGCRNVTHLLLPDGYDVNRIIANLIGYGNSINHNKYANNYDYNRAIFLMNKVTFLDNNFALFRESGSIHSPLSVIHYQFYSIPEEIELFLKDNYDSIQLVVGKDYVPFGHAQCPKLDDFADNLNTLSFLNSLN